MQENTKKILAGESLSEKENVVLRDPYAVEYLSRILPATAIRSRASPLLRRLHNEPTNVGRALILQNQ